MIQEKEEKLKALSFLIVKLDEFRALRRSDPERLRSAFLNAGFGGLFERIKADLERIAFFPETLPNLGGRLRLVGILRQLFPLCFFSIVLAFLIRIGIFKILDVKLYNFFLYIPIGIMFAFIVVDQSIRRVIGRYEEEHPELHATEREVCKRAVQELLDLLHREIRTYSLDTGKFRLRLYFDDYKGITVLKEYRERIMFVFKKKYSRFIVEPGSGPR